MQLQLVLRFTLSTSLPTVARFGFTAGIQLDRRSLVVSEMVTSKWFVILCCICMSTYFRDLYLIQLLSSLSLILLMGCRLGLLICCFQRILDDAFQLLKVGLMSNSVVCMI